MSKPKTTLGARAELAQCRSELASVRRKAIAADEMREDLAAARQRIAALESKVEHLQKPSPKHEPEVTAKKRGVRPPSIQGEVLMGAKAIADKFGFTRRQVYHYMEQLGLPHFHIGRVVCARPNKVREWLANLEAAEGGR